LNSSFGSAALGSSAINETCYTGTIFYLIICDLGWGEGIGLDSTA